MLMSGTNWIIWLIPLFPLLGFVLNALLIKRERQAGLVASLTIGASFAVAIVATVMLSRLPEEGRRIVSVLYEWISIGSFRIPFGLLFDPLTAAMTLLVTGVGGLIHIYSIGYMRGDSRPTRYFAALNLFVFSMLILVMAENMLLLFLGWEGVGLCSFLLISHYFDRERVEPDLNPSAAAMKAFVVNRIGDVGILLAMMAIFSRLGSLSFISHPELGITSFLDRVPELGFTTISVGNLGEIGVTTAIAMLLLLGVTGKSAQLPLYVWLPDAMAGPTPVSALIHAATMVTAGVYLIVRTHVLFDSSPSAAGLTVTIGLVTALLGASAALTQFDIKRVLAYSTISQLGFMIAAVGMGGYVAAMFHLLTHGIFKALLFLAAGAIIHGTNETQDMRKMGGLRTKMPTTFIIYRIGALSLSGIAPFAGFWSKDEIIIRAWFGVQSIPVAFMLIVASLLTAFYMGRQLALIFWGKQRDASYEAHETLIPLGRQPAGSHAHPIPAMSWPILILALGAILGGLINAPGLHWLGDFLKPVLNEPETVYEPSYWVLAAVVTLLSAGAMYLGWWVYAKPAQGQIRPGRPDPAEYYTGDIWKGAEIGWGLDYLYDRLIARPYRAFAAVLDEQVDRDGIDGVLVEGPGRVFGQIANGLRAAQSGLVRNYALAFLVGVIMIVGYFALRP